MEGYEMYDIDIINTEESYTAEFIKNWCNYQIKNEGEFDFYANEIYISYFDKNVEYKPNPKVYYYIWSDSRNFRHFVSLHRDLNKSPKKVS
jgi:hypothetical protein